MNDNFNDQKEKLISLSHEINLLRQQVNYLLRNEKPLGLLDLDVLMNRTHSIYDTLCAINLGDNADDEDLDLDPEAIAGLFGVDLNEEDNPETDEVEPIENQNNEEVIPDSVVEVPEETQEKHEVEIEEPAEPVDTPVEQPEETPDFLHETPIEISSIEETPLPDPEPQVFSFQEPVFQEPEPIEPEVLEPQPIEEPTEEIKPTGDEYGFLFRFEDAPANGGFETETPETLGDKMMQEDHSLAAKLQQNPVRDLRSVIGINDKFLFVNELFGGSMEKYNKSIDNLNDLKTMNGALIYLNELKIELQWNSSNEAYQKLSELVRRKFE